MAEDAPSGSRAPTVLSHLPVGLLEPVRAAHPDLEILEVPAEGPLDEGVRGDVLLTYTWGTPNLAQVLEHGVRWVHTFGTGVDSFPFAALGDRWLSCSRGASAEAISEWVIAVMLAAEKRFPEIWLDAPPPVWNRAELGSLAGRTLALVGLGGIGLAIARRALPFGMKVKALRRRAVPSPLPEVEVVTSLRELLSGAHHVVLAAPATAATRHLLDDESLAWLEPGAHVVNIARGSLVDQDALRRALDSERVGLASLDCVEPEPLPEGHWLYAHPRVRLSAHVSWSAPDALGGLVEPFVENLGRFRRGEALIDLVDVEEGY